MGIRVWLRYEWSVAKRTCSDTWAVVRKFGLLGSAILVVLGSGVVKWLLGDPMPLETFGELLLSGLAAWAIALILVGVWKAVSTPYRLHRELETTNASLRADIATKAAILDVHVLNDWWLLHEVFIRNAPWSFPSNMFEIKSLTFANARERAVLLTFKVRFRLTAPGKDGITVIEPITASSRGLDYTEPFTLRIEAEDRATTSLLFVLTDMLLMWCNGMKNIADDSHELVITDTVSGLSKTIPLRTWFAGRPKRQVA